MTSIISIASAAALTEQSERTLRRRIAAGSLPRAADESGSNRTMIPFDAVRSQIVIPLGADDMSLIHEADAGAAEAQTDLALLFLSYEKPDSAIYWLELAMKQDYAEAMHWLGRAYLEGRGISRNENLGLMWLSKAAAQGHAISQLQMQAVRDKVLGKTHNDTARKRHQ